MTKNCFDRKRQRANLTVGVQYSHAHWHEVNTDTFALGLHCVQERGTSQDKYLSTSTSHRYLCSATHGDLQVPRTRTVTYGPRSVAVVCPTIWNTAIDPTCIDHYTWTVSEWTKDNTVSFGLRDMTRRFRDCLGR